MLDLRIKEYLSKVGIRKISELDTALIETYGQEEGENHIDRLTRLYDRSEERLMYGAKDTPYLHRQEELVDYLNQSLQMSILAASFYDYVFFRRVMDYLLKYERYWTGDILDIGCGNGILACFLAMLHPESSVTGLDLSLNAVSVSEELAGSLSAENVHFACAKAAGKRMYDTLFSCRTVHENVAWRPLIEESKAAPLSIEEQTKRHEEYAKTLSAFIKPQGYLISVERYEDDSAYAGFVRAMTESGFCTVKGTRMQFSCKNGDETAAFQASVFQLLPLCDGKDILKKSKTPLQATGHQICSAAEQRGI